jgi:hypothetical protein
MPGPYHNPRIGQGITRMERDLGERRCRSPWLRVSSPQTNFDRKEFDNADATLGGISVNHGER